MKQQVSQAMVEGCLADILPDVLLFCLKLCVFGLPALDPLCPLLFVGAAGGSDSETSSSSDLTDSETASESESESDDDLEMHQVRPLPNFSRLHTHPASLCPLAMLRLTCCF